MSKGGCGEGLPGASLPMLPGAGRAVVGFSGGADSTALAHWLKGQVGPGRVLLAHVNHQLRGAESDRDEAHARDFAQKHGLAIEVLRADVGALAKKRGLGLEECGRQVRYAFFDSLAPGPDDRVLTAHNANDNAETMLLHLCRGASLPGLCGIPGRRGKVLRPLLAVSRADIERYCAAQGLAYVTDSSNLTLDYARNRVRHQAIPLLEGLNPQFIQACGRAMGQLSLDRDYLEGEAARVLERARGPFGLNCQALLGAHPALRGRALRQYLEQAGCRDLEEKHVALAEGLLAQGGGLSLPGGVQARCALGVFYAGQKRRQEAFSVPVGLGETRLPGGKRLVLRKISWEEGQIGPKIQNLLFKNALDYATIYPTGQGCAPIVARTRRPGDRFSPQEKPLKELFRQAGVPAWAREQAVLLEQGGRLLYCEGLGPGEAFRAQPGARDFLTVEVLGS